MRQKHDPYFVEIMSVMVVSCCSRDVMLCKYRSGEQRRRQRLRSFQCQTKVVNGRRRYIGRCDVCYDGHQQHYLQNISTLDYCCSDFCMLAFQSGLVVIVQLFSAMYATLPKSSLVQSIRLLDSLPLDLLPLGCH